MKYIIIVGIALALIGTALFFTKSFTQSQSTGTVIILNGPSGSGKSSIQREFQYLMLPNLWIKTGIDSLFDAPMPTITPENMNYWLSPNPIRWVETSGDNQGNPVITLFVGEQGEKVAYAMNSAIAEYAKNGCNVIVDYIAYKQEWLDDLQKKLKGIRTYYVAVEIPLEVLEQREAARGTSPKGHARSHYFTVYGNIKYDLRVNSGTHSAKEIAQQLKELIEPYSEKNKTMNTFLTQDKSGNPIRLEWEKIDGQSADLTQKIRSVSDILIQTYTKQELQFARIHPEAIPNEHFLKSLAPLFKDGNEQVDWKMIEEQINTIFRQFFTTTNFAQFSPPGEKHFFVVAKDPDSGQVLGFIQFLVNPEYPSGSVKAGMFGIIPEVYDRGLEKIFMSSIFKLMPDVSRIFIHTRSTNEKELAMYQSWGFVHTQQGYWVNSEYLAAQSKNLQEE